jgi:hypothetical protein
MTRNLRKWRQCDGYTQGHAYVVSNTTFQSSSSYLRFESTLDAWNSGVQSATLNSPDNTYLEGAVGGSIWLNNLLTDSPGATFVGGDITTTGYQYYGDPVNLAANASFTATDYVEFAGTLNDLTGHNGDYGASINAGNFTTFHGNVGSARALGADVLNGGGGDDILIGCQTAYDNDVAALSAVMSEWRSNGAYTTRVGHLTGPTGGLNGTTFLNSSTVFDDGISDTMTGGTGLDWFFARLGSDVITDLNSGGPELVYHL